MVRLLLLVLLALGSQAALAQSYQVNVSVNPPGAELFVQGGHAGTVSNSATVALPGPGVYSFRLEKPGYAGAEQLVYLDQARRTAQLNVSLVPTWQALLDHLADQAPTLAILAGAVLVATLLVGFLAQGAFGLAFAAALVGAVLGLTTSGSGSGSGAWAAAALAVFGAGGVYAYATGERPVRRPVLGALVSCALLVAAAWVIRPGATSATGLTATLPLGPFPTAASAPPAAPATSPVDRSTPPPSTSTPQQTSAPATAPPVERSTPAPSVPQRTQAPPAEPLASATSPGSREPLGDTQASSRRRSSESETAPGQLTRSTNPLAERLRSQELPQAAPQSTSPVQRSSTASAGDQPPAGASSAIPRSGLVNLNTASRSELEQIPGITPVAIQAILANRPFADEIQAQRTRGLSTIWREIEQYVDIR